MFPAFQAFQACAAHGLPAGRRRFLGTPETPELIELSGLIEPSGLIETLELTETPELIETLELTETFERPGTPGTAES